MNAETCHEASPREAIKGIVLDVLGVKRVAEWCEVTPAAVWQWLSRATEEAPFPVKRVGAIFAGARRDAVDFDRAPFLRLLGVEAEPKPDEARA
jgi:hypothetical protein